MNKKEEQKEEQGLEGSINSGCDVNADRCLEEQAKKKLDTSFVDERKKQIELYGNYYPAGLSDEGIIEWCKKEADRLFDINKNLTALRRDTEAKIESDRQAKLAATLAGLSVVEKEQLKTMLG